MYNLNLIFLILLILSCSNKPKQSSRILSVKETVQAGNTTKRLLENKKVMKQGEEFTYTDEFVSNFNKVIVTTYYINDSLSDNEAWEVMQWPIVKNQKITFLYKDSISSVFYFPSGKILRQTKANKFIEAAEIIIWDANFIQGKNEVYFGVFEASGICNGSLCPTYDGAFRLSGNPIYQIHSVNKKKMLILGGGRTENLLHKKGVSKLETLYDSIGITKKIMDDAYENRKRIGLKK